jgi:hypothetical protein
MHPTRRTEDLKALYMLSCISNEGPAMKAAIIAGCVALLVLSELFPHRQIFLQQCTSAFQTQKSVGGSIPP